ncbi:MAG: glutathione S-transferase family protein [Pseudomonadota bacterium]
MIKLHHLRIGRSVFTAWAMEELGLDYNVEIYIRDENRRAPPTLRHIHPLGKSPVIEDGDLTLAESGAILLYLIENYDPQGVFAPPVDAKEKALWSQWLVYPEASGFLPFFLTLLLSMEEKPKPPVIANYANADVTLHLNYIDAQLADNPFLLGPEFSAPDIGMTYLLELANRVGQLSDYPRLKDYIDRMMARPAFKRAQDKTGG